VCAYLLLAVACVRGRAAAATATAASLVAGHRGSGWARLRLVVRLSFQRWLIIKHSLQSRKNRGGRERERERYERRLAELQGLRSGEETGTGSGQS
jgi:hypothetical protein